MAGSGLWTLFGVGLFLSIKGILSQTFLKDLSIEFHKRSPTYCYVVLTSQNVSQDIFDLHDLGYPYYIFDTRISGSKGVGNLKNASRTCKRHIFLLKSLDEAEEVEHDILTKGTGMFAIIIRNWSNNTTRKTGLSGKGFFRGIVDLAIIHARPETKSYSILARKEIDEPELEVTNIWKNGKFLKDKPLFPRRLDNLERKTLKITSFNPYDPNFREGGYEMKLLKDLAKAMNFTYQNSYPSDGGLWGDISEEGIATGLVGDIMYGKCDIGFADLYMKPKRKEYIDYITPHTYDSACFMVPKPLPDAKWLDLLKPFDLEMWIAFIITYISGKLTKIVHGKYVPKGKFSRIFIGLAIFMTRILIISYQCNLDAVFFVHFTPKPVDSLKELADMDTAVGSFGTSYKDSLDRTLDPNLKEIRKRYTVYWDFGAAFKKASNNTLIMAEGSKFLDFNRRILFTNKYGETSMHITKECFNSFSIGFSVPLNSIYKEVLDRKMATLIEAGLPTKYFEYEMDKVASLSRGNMSEVDVKPLSLAHLSGPLVMLPILLIIGFIGFLIELGIHKLNH